MRRHLFRLMKLYGVRDTIIMNSKAGRLPGPSGLLGWHSLGLLFGIQFGVCCDLAIKPWSAPVWFNFRPNSWTELLANYERHEDPAEGETCPPTQIPSGQLDLGALLVLRTDKRMSAPANGACNGSIVLLSVLSQLMHTDLHKREFPFVSNMMQKYQANRLFVVEEVKGYLLYVVGHFVRRDGSLPRYLHGTCEETQHFIPNIMWVKPCAAEKDGPFVCVQQASL